MEETKTYNFISVRNSMRDDNRHFSLPEWTNQNLYCSKIISESIHDACKSYKTSFSLLKKKIISHFKVSYKNKKNRFQTISLEKSCFSSKGKNKTRY